MKNEIWFQEGPGVRTTQFRESGVKLLNGTNINNNKLNLKSTNRYITEKEAYGTYKHFLCDDGDLIIACSGITVERFNEKITFVRKKHLPLCMNTSTMRFKEKSGNISLEFFKYFLMSNLFKYQINRLVTGSAQLNFGPSHMEKVYLPICSINEQKKIVDELNLLRKSNLLLENKIKTSQSLQKSLINQIF
jgi:type I restriction enzyme S subunit